MINQKSIAVLPFVNISNSIDNEYFCDGITEEIINALTKVKGLKVTARTSSFAFKNKNIDVRHIGNKLGVATVLEGSIRIFKNNIRINVQLIRTNDGFQVWSQQFNRDLGNVFELQDEISLIIVEQIRDNFGHLEIQEHLVDKSTKSLDAYQFYLKGRFYQLKWTPESLKEAISYYNNAIKVDKDYAKAYYANLQCYGLLAMWGYMPHTEAMELAIHNLLIAKEIDKNLPEYPHSYVGKFFWGEWDFKNAYKFINQTLKLNPNYIDGLEAMAELFIALGFFDYAKKYANKLLEVDPISANNYYTKAHIYYYQRKYKKALETVNYALELNPDLELAHHLQCFCNIWLKNKKDFEDAIIGKKNFEEKIILYKTINEKNYEVPNSILNIKESIDLLKPYKLYILANSEYKKEAFSLLKEMILQKRGQIINFRQEPLLMPLHKLEGFSKLHQPNLVYSDIKAPFKKTNTYNVLNLKQLNVLKEELVTYLETEEPYLDPQFSLKKIAEDLKLNCNKVSYLINESFQVNFNDFINQYRLSHFKNIALDPKFKHITLLGLAYDSGFNSKSVFNTYFKKVEGITPSQWIKNQK